MNDGILDSNLIIDALNGYQNAVAWIDANQARDFSIVAMTWFEVIQGTRNKRELTIATSVLAGFTILYPTPADYDWAMQQYQQIHLRSGIDASDILIAAVAVRLQVPLLTRNVKHFAYLPNLDMRQPYA